jgi:hypothetical protein
MRVQRRLTIGLGESRGHLVPDQPVDEGFGLSGEVLQPHHPDTSLARVPVRHLKIVPDGARDTDGMRSGVEPGPDRGAARLHADTGDDGSD